MGGVAVEGKGPIGGTERHSRLGVECSNERTWVIDLCTARLSQGEKEN